MIPKIIHYIWLSDDPLNEVAERCVASWKRIAGDFEIRKWSMSDFNPDEMPDWVTEAISVKKWAFACDYLRLYVLEKVGGFYLDSDVLMLKSLDGFIDHGFVSSVEYYPELFEEGCKKVDENGYSSADVVEGMAIQAAVMGSIPGHPYVRSVMNFYENNHFINSDGSINDKIVAPHIYARIARNFGFAYKNCLQALGDIVLYESAVFSAGYEQSNSDSVVIHLCTNTWVDFNKQQHKVIEYNKVRLINKAEQVKNRKVRNSFLLFKSFISRAINKINKQAAVTDADEINQSEEKVKILVLTISRSGVYGGNAISRRNYDFLRSYFGEENVCVFECKPASPKNKYLKCLYKLLFPTEFDGFFLQKELKKIIAEKTITHVFCDVSCLGLFSGRFIKDNNFITFFHNVEARFFEDYIASIENSLSKIRKLFKRYKCFAIKTIEKRNCKCSALNITLNTRDSIELNKIYGRGSDLILPTSMADTYRRYDANEIPYKEDYLLFVGSNFFGNTDGLFDFIENCLPYINCNLLVVGTGMDSYTNKYDNDKVKFIGFVEDIGPYYAGAKAVVLPIISGSGMKTKTCESLMYGKVIFGTGEAFEGFTYVNEADCILCNSHEEFISEINSYLDKDVIPYFSCKSRAVFEKYYSDEAVYRLFKEKMDIITNK